MKKLILITALILSYTAQAQDTTKKTVGVDTMKLDFGSTTVIMFSNLDSIQKAEKKPNNFRSKTWSGIEVGATGYFTPDNTLNLPSSQSVLELDYSRSRVFGFNPIDITVAFGSKINLVTGLGIQYRNYGFKNNITLIGTKDSILGGFDTLVDYNKNKLRATYLQVPLLLEFNSKKDTHKGFHLSAGVIGGYKINSKMIYKYEVGTTEVKNKIKDHYQLTPFTLDLTARIGYGNLVFFANKSLTPLFEKNKGPELYPFSAGLNINF